MSGLPSRCYYSDGVPPYMWVFCCVLNDVSNFILRDNSPFTLSNLRTLVLWSSSNWALTIYSYYFLPAVCKSCLVKHLEENNTCPTCTIVIHQSHPLQYISFDRTMQDIVYKLVPGFQESKYQTFYLSSTFV